MPTHLFVRILAITALMLCGESSTAHAGSSFALPANQITGCPWDDDPENAGSAAVKGSTVKIGKDWYDVSGSVNKKAMTERLKACKVGTPTYRSRGRYRRVTGYTAATNFSNWRDKATVKKHLLGWGLLATATYGGVCSQIQIEDLWGIKNGACWLGGIYPFAVGSGGIAALTAGLFMKPKKFRQQFIDEVDGHFARSLEASEEIRDSFSKMKASCMDSTPQSTEAAKKAAGACEGLLKMLESSKAVGIVKGLNPPSLSAAQQARTQQSARALSLHCEDYRSLTTAKEIKEAATACNSLVRSWSKSASELSALSILSKDEASATYRRANTRQQEVYKEENSPERRAAKRKATSDCTDVYTTFAKDSAKTKDGWMACCTASVLKRGDMGSPNKIIRECKGK